jgi:hypothetical protein
MSCESLNLLPEPHPKRQELLELLAHALQKRFTQTGDHADKEAADTISKSTKNFLPFWAFLVANKLTSELKFENILHRSS